MGGDHALALLAPLLLLSTGRPALVEGIAGDTCAAHKHIPIPVSGIGLAHASAANIIIILLLLMTTK